MQLTTDASGKEIKEHGSYEFPVFISHEQLSGYEQYSFTWHYHPEIELTLIREGSMFYQVNDITYEVHEGEGIFCNTNALHTGHSLNLQEKADCRYLSVTCSPRLLSGFSGSRIQTQYVEPLLSSTQLSSFHFTKAVEWQKEVLEHLDLIDRLNQAREKDYEIQILIHLLEIWALIYRKAYSRKEIPSASKAREVERLRAILDYVHTHYAEHITLEEIASEINICRSECCRFFKSHMNQSLFEYILEYRIRQSLTLLSGSDLSITEIAEQTGFSTPAYFAKIFREKMGITPKEYRKQQGVYSLQNSDRSSGIPSGEGHR